MVVVTERVTLEIIRGWHKTLWKFMGWIAIAHYNFLNKKIFSIHGHACLATAVSNSSASAFLFHIYLVCIGSQRPYSFITLHIHVTSPLSL